MIENKEKKYSISPERLEGETYEEYKRRQRLVKRATKIHLRGIVAWPSRIVKRDTIGNPIKGKEELIGNTLKKEKR